MRKLILAALCSMPFLSVAAAADEMKPDDAMHQGDHMKKDEKAEHEKHHKDKSKKTKKKSSGAMEHGDSMMKGEQGEKMEQGQMK